MLSCTQKIRSLLLRFRSFIPFWQHWIISNLVGKSNQLVLDVGCGPGESAASLKSRLGSLDIIGCDIYMPSLLACKKGQTYRDVICCDITSLPMKPRSFSVCIAEEVIEHLKREEGFELMEVLENIATEVIVVTTPNGFSSQEGNELDNRYETHKSGWTVSDFQSLGYKVWGNGFPRMAQIQIDHPKIRPFLQLAHVVTNAISYFIPSAGGGLIAAKIVGKEWPDCLPYGPRNLRLNTLVV